MRLSGKRGIWHDRETKRRTNGRSSCTHASESDEGARVSTAITLKTGPSSVSRSSVSLGVSVFFSDDQRENPRAGRTFLLGILLPFDDRSSQNRVKTTEDLPGLWAHTDHFTQALTLSSYVSPDPITIHYSRATNYLIRLITRPRRPTTGTLLHSPKDPKMSQCLEMLGTPTGTSNASNPNNGNMA